MATKLYINYVRQSDVPSAHPVKKIHVRADKYIQVKERHPGHGGIDTIDHYNFSNAVETQGSVQVPRGYSEILYRYMIDADGTLHAWICCVVPENTALPVPDYQEKEYTSGFPVAVFLAQGETNTLDNGGGQPNWLPGALTTADKKARAITKIRAFREQKKTWLLEAPEYADLVSNIVTHLGYWLRSADYVIKLMYDQGVAGTLDWLIVEKIAAEAIKGPRTLDPDGDGAYNVGFFQRLKVATTNFPTGPSFGALWVRTWDLTGVGDVDRVADFTANVISSHGSTDPALPDRTYHDIPATYNSTTEYWTS